MRIALHDYGGYPFTAQLGRALAARGHDVTYLFAAGIKTPRARVEARGEDAATIAYRGIDMKERYHRAVGIRRFAQERRYGTRLASEIHALRPDIVLSANCPLPAQLRALGATHELGAGFVHWCQDVYSLAVSRLLARRLGIVGRAIGSQLAVLERKIVQRSDAVVLITDDFRPAMRTWDVPDDRVHVIENWAPLDEVRPMPKANSWAQRHGLKNAPAVLYAGTLGRKHDPGALVRLATAFPDAQVIVVAEGVGADRLRRLPSPPPNLILLPPQPARDVPAMLASADVLVALLEPDALEFSVPSKILTYLATCRPILASMPLANLGARTIRDANAGIVVEPGDHGGFASAARHLLEDESERTQAGARGRAYAERAFDVGAKAEQFERIFHAASKRNAPSGIATRDTGPDMSERGIS